MLIRKVKEIDVSDIYNLVELAFKTAQVSNDKEQDFYYSTPKQCSLYSRNGTLIGHIMLTN